MLHVFSKTTTHNFNANAPIQILKVFLRLLRNSAFIFIFFIKESECIIKLLAGGVSMSKELSLVIDILIIIEIVIAEFIAVWFLSHKKHNFIYCLLSYIGLTAIVVVLMVFLLSKSENYGNGAGGNMIIGIIYLIPILFNYAGSFKKKLFVSFYSFSYGIIIFAISVRLSYLFKDFYLNVTALVIQTIIYGFSLPFFIKYSRKAIMPAYDSASNKNQTLITTYTIMNFVIISQFNMILTQETTEWLKAFVYILFAISLVAVFSIIGLFLKFEGNISKLNISIQKDQLTKLGNRLAFKTRSEALQSSNTPFYLLFMDLDRFKSINDKYGHAVGDSYLKLFAARLQELSNENTTFYRMSGDEFVCISTSLKDCQDLISIDISQLGECPFLGFSFGLVKYPDETCQLTELIELADKRMYIQKKKKL